jgi:uncharacterized protein YbbC (DUF1343 family)
MRWTTIALIFLVACLVATHGRAQVRLGSEVLAEGGFRELQGKRVGLITNPSGVNRRGQTTIELLRTAPGVRLVALFGPEHGVYGDAPAGAPVVHQTDPRTGLPVHSLYGPTRKPTPAMLKGLDALVYDLQDTGCRSYTFISTMGLAMEACAEAGIEFIVLDRPNPLGGLRIEGPLLDPDFRSFVGYWRVPYVYGLTAGELARMIDGELWIAKPCRLTVIPMRGWNRTMVWRQTGLPWVPTSPNVPSPSAALGYAATGLFGEIAGGSGVTIGIPFQRPFECVAAVWLDAARLSRQLNGLDLPGVVFDPFQISHRDRPYQGVTLRFTDLSVAPLVPINLHLLEAIRATSGRDLFAEAMRSGRNLDMHDKVWGTDRIRRQLQAGTPVADIVRAWRSDETAFRAQRRPYLLYPEPATPSARPAATAPAPAQAPARTPDARPAPAPPARRVAPVDTHYLITIRRGDTITKIAADFGVSISDIVLANPGLDADRIAIGQQIRVPRRGPGPRRRPVPRRGLDWSCWQSEI